MAGMFLVHTCHSFGIKAVKPNELFQNYKTFFTLYMESSTSQFGAKKLFVVQ